MANLKIQNNILVWADTGVAFKINEANSPESRLRDLSYAELDQIFSYGVNTLYFSAFGGDIKTIHPFKDRANPALGFDDAKLLQWKNYAEYWVNLGGGRNVLHILLSEKENHFELNETDHKAFLDKIVQTFGHLPVIWDREELPEGQTAYINKYYAYLKSINPNNIRGIHNNTNENPWRGFESSDLIQFLSFQEWVGNFNNRINTEVVKNPNWGGYASEVTGGFLPGEVAKAETLFNAGRPYNSGVGVFISSKDHSVPNFQSEYQTIYQKIADLSNNTNPNPNPTTMKLYYSTSADRSNPVLLTDGMTLPAQPLYIEAKEVTAPVTFVLEKNGAVVVNRSENGAPFDLMGGGASATPYNASAGAYKLTATDKVGSVIVNFSVGVTPPPVTYVVSAISSNQACSTSGSGTYNSGSNATVTALACQDCTFVNWTVNGSQVSANAAYTFPVNGNVELVANYSCVSVPNKTRVDLTLDLGSADLYVNGVKY